MILTVCLNPSFDKTAVVEALRPGETNRIRPQRVDLGGKGINISRVLGHLGTENRCLLCAGEEHANRLGELLEKEKVRYTMLELPGEVRTNIKLTDLNTGRMTELNEPGPLLSCEKQEEWLELYANAARGAKWSVLTGSLLPGADINLYGRMLQFSLDCRSILDAEGEALLRALPARPWLVKPNREELARTVGMPVDSQGQIRAAAEKLLALGAENVLVSLGGDGAMMVNAEGCLYAPAVPVKVRGTVGAGDTMVASLLHALENGRTLREAFRWAVAGATCSVMMAGTQAIGPEDLRAMLENVQLMEVK